MQKIEFVTERIVKWFAYAMLIITVFIALVAMFSNETQGEAETGSFDSIKLSDGWFLETAEGAKPITLPASVEVDSGEVLKIRNRLPDDLSDGSSMLVRASMADIYIYINGEQREQYAAEFLPHVSYYIPSAYVVTELSERDSGAEVEILVGTKSKGNLNEVRISNGNNVWFDIIKKNISVNAVALIVLILGIILVVVANAMQYMTNNFKMALYMGLLMTDLAIWVFSESEIRQLVFKRPSLSCYFSYFSVELLGILACMYFDEIQHRRHHKGYAVMEAIISIQLSANMILHFTGILDLYRSLMFSHIWMGTAILMSFIYIGSDIRTKNIKQYKATALGLVVFLGMAVMELVGFYVTRYHVFGIFVCIGMIVLAATTVIQILLDQISSYDERHNKQTKTIVNAIETIAAAIDAKDEYTGGHSERVGRYAAILARGMAADYDLSEEDILQINYIGLMHDIGKIGVADTVLNKVGRLTENEYSLMKKHVDIGAEIMAGMDESIPGLADGIRYHHERFDGKGYPEGLSDTEIPLVARVLCLADCYDAMTSNRIYRKRLTDDEVRAELIRCSGTQFDPALTEIFISLLDSGDMHPYTVDGMATLEKGKILKSSILENHLQKLALSGKHTAKNPEHVRMLCFIIKLKEKKGERVDVVFVELADNTENGEAKIQMPEQFITSQLNKHDLSVEYSNRVRIVALSDRTDEQIESFEKQISTCGPGIICTRI